MKRTMLKRLKRLQEEMRYRRTPGLRMKLNYWLQTYYPTLNYKASAFARDLRILRRLWDTPIISDHEHRYGTTDDERELREYGIDRMLRIQSYYDTVNGVMKIGYAELKELGLTEKDWEDAMDSAMGRAELKNELKKIRVELTTEERKRRKVATA